MKETIMKKALLAILITSFFIFGFILFYKKDTPQNQETNTTSNKSNKTDNLTSKNTPTPPLTSLTLHINTTSLKEDTNTTFTLIATDTNDTNKTIQNNIKWKIKNKSLLHVKNNTILAKQEGKTTIQAIYENKKSNTITINIYKEINGYILPPEPDKKLNNKTILGIDINNNGIRDDVERYIIQRYAKEEYPKTRTAIALQYAWASQKILENPTIESAKYQDDAIDCQYFWFDTKQKDINNKIMKLAETDFNASIKKTIEAGEWRKKHKVFGEPALKDKIFNTKQRILQEFKFNEACSGHIFDGRKESIENCKTNILELGE